jgi:hypothetical protein
MHEVQSIKDLVFIIGGNSESSSQKVIFEILADGVRKANNCASHSTPAPISEPDKFLKMRSENKPEQIIEYLQTGRAFIIYDYELGHVCDCAKDCLEYEDNEEAIRYRTLGLFKDHYDRAIREAAIREYRMRESSLSSTEILHLAKNDWHNREERRGIHAKTPFVAGWITGFLTPEKPDWNKVMENAAREDERLKENKRVLNKVISWTYDWIEKYEDLAKDVRRHCDSLRLPPQEREQR